MDEVHRRAARAAGVVLAVATSSSRASAERVAGSLGFERAYGAEADLPADGAGGGS